MKYYKSVKMWCECWVCIASLFSFAAPRGLIIITYFFLLFVGILTVFLVVSLIVVTSSFPTKRSSQCQRNNDVRTLLGDALRLTPDLARQSSVLSLEVVRVQPTLFSIKSY